jgi:RHS repeat-associated protein
VVKLDAAGGLAGDSTVLSYDNVGNLLQVTDPAGNVYQYQYNALGAATQRTDPAGSMVKYFLDAEAAPRSTVNRRGDSVWADLDALHRPVAKTIKIGASVVRRDSLFYDPHGLWSAAHNAVSRDTVVNDSTGWPTSSVTRLATDWSKRVQIRYTREANSRLDSVHVVLSGSIAATWRRYTWNSSTGTLAAVYLNGSSVTFGYNSELLPSTMTQPGGLTRNLSPSSIHELFKAGYGTQGVDTLLWRGMELDTLGRVVRQYAYANSQVDKTQYTYRYDPRGRLTAVHDSTLLGASTCDGVDFGVRLCSGYTPMLNYRDSLAYDRLGNTTYADGYISGTGAATYTKNRITGWPGYTFARDSAGNITQRSKTGGATTNFYWSADGLLDSVIVGARKIRYDYNALGQLVRKRVDGDGTQWRHFFWDQGHLLAELDSALTSRVGEYAYYPGTDRPMAFLAGATTVTSTSYFQQDVQGSVIGLTTSAGAVQSAVIVSRPWGEYEFGMPSVPTTVRLRWQGLFYEGDSTQLYYVRARWYDPVTHRFLTQDPLGLEGGANPYTFGGNDPVNNSDPSGLIYYDCGVWWYDWECQQGQGGWSTRDWEGGVLGGGDGENSWWPADPGGLWQSRSSVATWCRPATGEGCSNEYKRLLRIDRPLEDPGFWDPVQVPVQIATGFIGVPAGAGGAGAAKIVSRIGEVPALTRIASAIEGEVQLSIDRLTAQLAKGNMNPGIGTRYLFSGILEARARDGARVYFRHAADNTIEILAKSTKHTQEQAINLLRRLYE